ncbi:hypothetical protein BJX76DRAFT_344612 [Aspergillus varians]
MVVGPLRHASRLLFFFARDFSLGRGGCFRVAAIGPIRSGLRMEWKNTTRIPEAFPTLSSV